MRVADTAGREGSAESTAGIPGGETRGRDADLTVKDTRDGIFLNYLLDSLFKVSTKITTISSYNRNL